MEIYSLSKKHYQFYISSLKNLLSSPYKKILPLHFWYQTNVRISADQNIKHLILEIQIKSNHDI